MKRPNARQLITTIFACAALAGIAQCCGCASIRDRAQTELDRLDTAALLERFLEEIAPASPLPEGPPPTEGDPGAPIPPSQTGDEIDLAGVTWHGPDIRGWPVASDMPQGAYVSGSTLHFQHSKAGTWSANAQGLEGNPWVIVQVHGQWRAATFEWLRSGQTSKPWEKVRADHIKVGAFDNYQLKRGEEFYVVVSGRARGAERGTPERTAARKVVWR
jgi:hypothetical protein